MKSGQETSQKTAEFETKQEETEPEAVRPQVPKHEVDAIIRKRMYANMIVGMAPVPLLDLAGISAVQVEMVRALAKRYEVPFRAQAAKTIISSLVGGALPVAFAPFAASLLKFIPIIGWTTAGVSMSILGGAVTYAVGQVFATHFSNGGGLFDFNVDKYRSTFQSKVREGQAVASKMKEEQQANA